MNDQVNSAETAKELEPEDRLSIVYRLVLKLIGVGFLSFTIWHWYQLIGFVDESVRFDTMAEHSKVANVALAVLQPVVAIGLWAAFPWGVAVWLIAALIELLMYVVYSDLFGTNDILVAFHAGCALIMATLQIMLRFGRSSRAEKHPFTSD